ncbi:outer membrane protein [Methylopila sp. 73B]|uniref:outer membrane protein n=1 Tax=Methylopila sp. 73B TaxID=1120792 RepID=UPI00037E4D21|nr:outer membrane protein [Methylopila sp. 73B]
MLRHRLAVAVSAAALSALATGAFAADLPAYEPAPSIAVPSFTWTGAYVGVQAGYGFGDSNGRGIDPDGFLVGAYAGYNYQFDNSPLVIGVETDFNYADVDDSRFGVKLSYDWAGATRARIGYAFDRFLVYGAAGVAYADREVKVSGVGKNSKTAVGWTAGGGVEFAATDNVVARAEYRYTDYGRDTFRIAGESARVDSDEHRVMVGVAYKFGW